MPSERIYEDDLAHIPTQPVPHFRRRGGRRHTPGLQRHTSRPRQTGHEGRATASATQTDIRKQRVTHYRFFRLRPRSRTGADRHFPPSGGRIHRKQRTGGVPPLPAFCRQRCRADCRRSRRSFRPRAHAESADGNARRLWRAPAVAAHRFCLVGRADARTRHTVFRLQRCLRPTTGLASACPPSKAGT